MNSHRTKKKKDVGVEVEYSGGLTYPALCVSCNEKVTDKKIPFTMYNAFYTRKLILNFPVCEECYQAKKDYINVRPVIIVGAIIFVLSLFTLFNQPDYLPFSSAVHLIAGLVWLAILVGYVLYMILKAKRTNTGEVKTRRDNLMNAVKGVKFQYVRKTHKKILDLTFTNEAFAKEFMKLNKGKWSRRN